MGDVVAEIVDTDHADRADRAEGLTDSPGGGDAAGLARSAGLWALVGGAAWAVVVMVLTRRGVGLDPDSAVYLKAARLFRHHLGAAWHPPHATMVDLGSRFPPGYPLLLAAARIGETNTDAVRWVGVVTAATSGACLAWLLRRRLPPRWAAGVFGLVSVNRSLLHVLFGFALSDGARVALALLALVALEPLLTATWPRRWWPRVLAVGVLTGLAFGVRIDGLADVFGAAAALALFTRAAWPRRLGAAALVLAVGVVPVGLVLLHQSTGSSVDGRTFGWYRITSGDWTAVDHLATAYLPDPVTSGLPSTLRVVMFVGLVGAFVWSARLVRTAMTAGAEPVARLAAAIVLFGWLQVTVTTATRLMFDPGVPISGRHTMLWWICLVAAGGLDLHRRLAAATQAWPYRLASVAAALAGISGLLLLGRSLRDPTASWYTLRQDEPSALTDQVRAEPSGLTIYTDREEVVYLFTHRPTRPINLDPDLIQTPPSAAVDELRHAIRGICAGHDVLALYSSLDALPPEQRTLVQARLEAVTAAPPGAIYRCRRD